MLQQNESLLISDQEGNPLLQSKQLPLDPFGMLLSENKSILLNQSINFSSVNHKDGEDSGYCSFLSKIYTGPITEQQSIDLKGRYIRLKNKYDKLCQQHQVLKNRLERQESGRGNRMSSSTKFNNSRVQIENTRRRMVSLNKNSKLIESVHHPVSMGVLQKRDFNLDIQPILKDTKTLLLFQEATKLQDMFSAIKSDLGYLQEWMSSVTEDRGSIIRILSGLVGDCLGRVGRVENIFQEFEVKVSELVYESKRTREAYSSYKKSSSNLIEYYKLKCQALTKARGNSNKSKSAGRASDIDTTTGFKFVIPRCFVDYSELESVSELERVINEEVDGDSLGVNEEEYISHLKKKVEEYIREIYSIKEAARGEGREREEPSSLQNPSVKEWLGSIRSSVMRVKRCGEYFREMYKQRENEGILQESFKENIGQVERELRENGERYSEKIVNCQSVSQGMNLFVTSVYSMFGKTLMTNLINIGQFNTENIELVRWRRIAMDSLRGVSTCVGAIVESQVKGVDIRQRVREEEQFILRVVKYVEYLNTIIRELRTLIL